METILFDPSVDQLQQIVAATSKITADDLSDDVQLALVHDTRIQLRDARVRIEKTGKALRADALKYQKDVIAREKELLGIILPEEDRLADIEEEASKLKERAARVALLPMRKEQLEKFENVIDDEAILYMDNDQFVAYLVELQTKKNEADRLEIEAEKKRLAEESVLAQVKKDAEVAERNRIEEANRATEQMRIDKAAHDKREAEVAAQKLIDDAKAEADRVLKEAEDKVRKEQEAKLAAELEAEAQKKQREADEKYQEWLVKIGWKQEEDARWIFEAGVDGVSAYKLVDTFKK
jgi:hypothetical protein